MSAAETKGSAAPQAATARELPWRVVEGDCVEVLAAIEAESVDAIVTDPPYGIGINQERWDAQDIRETAARAGHQRISDNEAFELWCHLWAQQCLRVLKPGAHLLASGSPRTAHRLACGLEDAGFQLRDTLIWFYGTGLPKSRRLPGGGGTALKPSYEPILLARRPPQGTVRETIKRHGTGALNIDACRNERRHPANVLASHAPGCTAARCERDCAVALINATADRGRGRFRPPQPASRLFYCPKVSRRERDAGCEQLPAGPLELFPQASRRSGQSTPARNRHPTVKPLALMRWLVRLACPPGGLVLDPFCGSGSTGAAATLEQRSFIGIESNRGYVQIAQARIAHWANESHNPPPFDSKQL